MDSNLQKKQNLEPLALAEQGASLDSSKPIKIQDEQSKRIAILFQYKMLQMYGSLLGIYAIPNLDNYKVWNCIIFVRKGFFKDGKFKFDISFTKDFPSKSPIIQFKSPVFHPLVREDGIVDITQILGEQWNYQNENMLYSLFSNLEKIFVDRTKLEIQHSYNPQAARMLSVKPHSFIEKALQSVELSQDKLYQNEAGTSLVIKKYANGELDPYKEKLESLCQQNKAPQDKRKQFLNFVMSQNIV